MLQLVLWNLNVDQSVDSVTVNSAFALLMGSIFLNKLGLVDEPFLVIVDFVEEAGIMGGLRALVGEQVHWRDWKLNSSEVGASNS